MATAQFSSPNPRAWLEIDNFSTVSHNNNTGQFGEYQRGAAYGYNDETLLKFDVSSISGTVTSVSLQITCNNAGSQGSFTTTANLYEQDKTAYGSWSSPVVYNDFANTAWSNSLQTVTVGATGSYTFTTTAGFVTCVQSWLDNSANNWGVIVAASWNALNWYLSLDAATLTVNYTPSVSETTQFIFMD